MARLGICTSQKWSYTQKQNLGYLRLRCRHGKSAGKQRLLWLEWCTSTICEGGKGAIWTQIEYLVWRKTMPSAARISAWGFHLSGHRRLHPTQISHLGAPAIIVLSTAWWSIPSDTRVDTIDDTCHLTQIGTLDPSNKWRRVFSLAEKLFVVWGWGHR